MDLGGTWRAYPADDELRRSFADPAWPDEGWDDVWVPGHWRSAGGFAGSGGPVLYRRPFEADRPGPAERVWITFEGIFYLADVWLDGAYLGNTEGYFFPQTFEVTDQIQDRTEHLLAVEVACDAPRDLTAKRNLTGVFQHADYIDPDWNPGGLWRPVRLDRTGPVRLSRLRVLCADASPERATLEVRAVLDAATATGATLRTSLTAESGDAVLQQDHGHQLAAGENRVRWTVVVEQPRLWWPHALGAQPRYHLEVAVEVGGDRSDGRVVPVGLRQVRMRHWIFTVNGERLFLKGANYGPTRMALADARPADFDADVVAARDAGLDLLRVHGHISRPELYDAADRHGMLLWQDLPLQQGYARSVRKEAVRQAREAVDLLGHHPSVAIWCGHNEPAGWSGSPVRVAAGQELPTFNKTVLDGSIRRALERADSTRPVIAHSGVLPTLTTADADSHLSFGWAWGEERDLARWLARVPRLAEFVSEFGAQAVPTTDDFLQPGRWPDLDWERLGRTHGLQKDIFDRRVPPGDYPTLAGWREATQRYQADLLRRHIEVLRRLKYRPAGGFSLLLLADSHPAVSWSLLDHRRVPKAAYQAVAEACEPVIVVADRPLARYGPGQEVAWDVHVVSDLHQPIERAVVTARVTSEAGEQQSWAWAGPIEADTCVRVGTVRTTTPGRAGPFVLELDLEAGSVKATNRYLSAVDPDAG